MNNAAVSLLSCIIYASIYLCARDFLFVFLFFDVSILVLTLLCCVSQGADPHSLHFPDSCVACLASGLSQREVVVGEQGGRGERSQSLAQIVSFLHLQLSLHRSTLLLASVQRLQLTPLLEPHSFVPVDWGSGGFLSG